MKRNLSITALLIASIALLGCTTNQLSTDLAVVADASTAATVVLTGLSIAGVIPPAVADKVVTYLEQVNAAIPDVQKELNSTDPLPQKITVISVALSNYISVDIPDLPIVGQAMITAIEEALKVFLKDLKASTPALLAVRGSQAPAPLKLSHTDQQIMNAAVKQAKDNLKRLAEYRRVKK